MIGKPELLIFGDAPSRGFKVVDKAGRLGGRVMSTITG